MQVFPDGAAVADAACTAAYACPANSDWGVLSAMLDSAGSALQRRRVPSQASAPPADGADEGWDGWDGAGRPARDQQDVEARLEEARRLLAYMPACRSLWMHMDSC